MTGDATHVPVLLQPALDALNIRADGIYVDGTYGRGGHSEAMLSRLGPEGQLVMIDRDPQAIADAHARFSKDARVRICRASFAEMGRLGKELGIERRVSGLLLDVGVSSPQLDDAGRGFSFREDGPLDMRMDPEAGESAADWLARAEESEIARVIREYGEERRARRIARKIVMTRDEQPIARTAQLAALVAAAVGGVRADRHPATRTFQAIRIHINRELESLEQALADGIDLLEPGGRFVVISFHSLEDRIVKHAFRAACTEPGLRRYRLLTKHPVTATDSELATNPRSRSAKLRAIEYIG